MKFNSLDISPWILQKENQSYKVIVYTKALREFMEAGILALDLNPENELAKKSISRTLAEMPTVTTANSKFIVHIQIIVRDSENNLLGVFESTNARYLPSKFFDIWWDKLDSKGMIFKENGNEIWKI